MEVEGAATKPITRARARCSSLLVLAALLAIAACSGDGSESLVASTSTSTSSTSTTELPCVVDDGTAEDLEPLVTDDVPAGYSPAPDAAEDTGPVDLYLAAFFVGSSEEEAELSRLGFRRGYQRLWYGPDGAGDLIVHLYEFCDVQGPVGYLRHTRERLLSPLWGSVEIDVTDEPGAGITLLQEAEPGAESFVAFLQVAGRFYIEVGAYDVITDTGVDRLTAKARALSEAQLAELA